MAMDKYEFNLKVDQMRKQYDLHDYQTAMKIADGIDWRRVTNVNLLSLVSDIYEKNGELEEAKEILLLAMESASNARHIVFRLTELAIRTGNMEEADAFCAEFEDLAHDDPRKYLLQYKILSAKGAAPEQKIIPLERYTATEIDEQWMYELAEQYLEAGQTAKCVAMCDRIMLFFGTGEYVQKAAELKADGAGAALSAYQQDLINNREKAEEKLRITEEKCRQAAEVPEVPAEAPAAVAPAAVAAEAAPDAAAGISTAPAAEAAAPAFTTAPAAEAPAAPASEAAAPAFTTAPAAAAPAAPAAETAAPVFTAVPAAAAPAAPVPETVIPAAAAAIPAAAAASAPAPAAAPAWTPATAPAAPVRTPAPAPALQTEFAEEYVPSYIPFEPLDEGAKPPIQDALDAQIAEHMKSLEARRAAIILKAQEAEAARAMEDAKAEEAARAAAEAARAEEAARAAANPPIDDITRVLPSLQQAKAAQAAEEEIGGTKVLPDIRVVRKEAAEKAAAEAAAAEEKAAEAAAQEPRTPGSYSAFVEGKTPEEGLEAAKRIMVEMRRVTGTKNPAAKIHAGKLNEKGVDKLAAKLSSGDIIIEDAGDLSAESAAGLVRILKADNGQHTMLLVDNPLQLSRLAGQSPELAELLHAAKAAPSNAAKAPAVSAPAPAVRPAAAPAPQTPARPAPAVRPVQTAAEPVRPTSPAPAPAVSAVKPAQAGEKRLTPAEIAYTQEELGIDEFAHYASDYAKKIDCVITGKSMLALYERIEIMQEDGVLLTRQNAEALIEEAADKAEKPPLLKKIGGIFSRKYDKEGMLILKEEDFIS
jgi:hypothetical protein